MAKIRVDLERTLGPVDPRVYGGFIEHLGRCIYGGIFEEGSPLSDARGFRRDVADALRALRPPVLRWPGGNFVSGYHWLDGVGPVDRRPRRMDLAWHAEESNRFGTDEFVEYCRFVGAEPFICVNMGSGTMDEAQAWVEYCNGTGNTHWANLRRANGHPEPYRVKYWGLGNEIYGHWQIGAKSADDYVKAAREFAKVMRLTDPPIELVSCGRNGWSDWDRVVLEGLAPFVAWHSIHIYTGSHDYYENVLMPHQAEHALRTTQALIDQVRYEQGIRHPIHVAYDEWNVWFRERSPEARRAGIEERYTLADALAVASFLNAFIRHCRTVKMANLAQMVNVIAPIYTSREGLFLQTIYHPLRLYAEHAQGTALDVHVECGMHDLAPEPGASPWPYRLASLGPFKLLDVAATHDARHGALTLAVVNRDEAREIATTIQLVDAAAQDGTAHEVNATHPGVVNSFEQPEAVSVRERRLTLGGSRFEYAFPAHSITLLRLQLT